MIYIYIDHIQPRDEGSGASAVRQSLEWFHQPKCSALNCSQQLWRWLLIERSFDLILSLRTAWTASKNGFWRRPAATVSGINWPTSFSRCVGISGKLRACQSSLNMFKCKPKKHAKAQIELVERCLFTLHIKWSAMFHYCSMSRPVSHAIWLFFFNDTLIEYCQIIGVEFD